MATNESVKNKLVKQQEKKAVSPIESFQGVLTSQLSTQFKAIQSLVPKHVTPERLCRIGLNAVSRNPQLMNCTPETIIGSIVNCASLGLEPNLLGHAYIVPFKNNKTGRMEAQFQIGYKGALDLVRRTGAVSTISAHEVYEGDKFEYAYGLDERLVHIPCGEDSEDKITHFYACYKLKDGGNGFVVMSKQQMDKHRDKFTKSKFKGQITGPWKDHYVSMGLKTVILKLIKYMPISIEQHENQTILEGFQRDNTTMTIKTPKDSIGFGDSFIEPEFVVSDSEEVDDEIEGNEVVEEQVSFEGTPFEE
ncbi:recombinase RecT [Clostridium cylindrosporum]|uniref:Protein RecT n=1 Tax=Clostridium cylindrosporum DSM 605 TaxID=1121307 RepID=A0A0J8DB96_CLOCY|nr:recombinase RecT [Clostridium cylindrosporum]KMT21574.1 protein RecT [Clostridium cylindrosporum DSM 605]